MTRTLGDYLIRKIPKLPDDLTQFDAELLLAHAIGKPRTWLPAHLDSPLTPTQLTSVDRAFSRLEAGEPLPYIIGHWEFFGLDFTITPDVLVPRPENCA